MVGMCVRLCSGLLLLFTRRVAAAAEAFEAALHASSRMSLGSSLGFPLGVCVNDKESAEEEQEKDEDEDSWDAACLMFSPTPHAVCCNNSAVAKFFSKRLEDATTALEGLVHGNPVRVYTPN